MWHVLEARDEKGEGGTRNHFAETVAAHGACLTLTHNKNNSQTRHTRHTFSRSRTSSESYLWLCLIKDKRLSCRDSSSTSRECLSLYMSNMGLVVGAAAALRLPGLATTLECTYRTVGKVRRPFTPIRTHYSHTIRTVIASRIVFTCTAILTLFTH